MIIKVPIENLNDTASKLQTIESKIHQDITTLNSSWNSLKLEAASKKTIDDRIVRAKTLASRLAAESNRLSNYVFRCSSRFLEADRNESNSLQKMGGTFNSFFKKSNTSSRPFNLKSLSPVFPAVGLGFIAVSGIFGSVLLPWIKGLISPEQRTFVPPRDEPSMVKVDPKYITPKHEEVELRESADIEPSELTSDIQITQAEKVDNWKKELLVLIAKHESRGNYNAISGNANNQNISITEMTIAEVQELQASFREHGMYSSAVGKYQVIRTTLSESAQALSLPPDTIFNEETQDMIAMHLLRRRGYDDFINGNITEEEFANRLSREWAALPLVSGDRVGESYYQGDGLNKALVEPETVLNLLRTYPR